MKKDSNNNSLPTLAELHLEPELAYKNDQLNFILSQPTPSKYVKVHPYVTTKDSDGRTVKLEYVPVDKVRYMLTRIFQTWKPEVISIQQMFQSVVCIVRCHYKNPVTGEWMFADGVGAVAVQTDKGASAADLAAIKSDAVMKAAPAAKSYALKNAAEEIGNIFGGGLNKWDIAVFKGSYDAPQESENYGAAEAPPSSGQTAPETTNEDFEL